MAKVAELNQQAWREWVASRPEAVRVTCEKWPPDRLYRMSPTGQRVTILSYGEDGTVRVFVSGAYNFCLMPREVFGVDPTDLEECDLPGPDELLGSPVLVELSEEEIANVQRTIAVTTGEIH